MASDLNSGNQTINLTISGMSCASCVSHVEQALAAVTGVAQATVNLATEQAQVRVTTANSDALLAAVAAAGYQATVISAGAPAAAGSGPRLWPVVAGGLLSLPLLLPMVASLGGSHWLLPAWLQALLATPIQIGLAAPFYRGAWHALRSKRGNMDLLVVIGTSAAYGLSLGLWLLAPADQPLHLYFEASAVVITLVLLGKWLEARAKRQTTLAIRRLQQLRPDTVVRRTNDGDQVVMIDDLEIGDLLVIKPGERLAVDGVIRNGEGQLDESLITGESRPLTKGAGDAVVAGSINLDGLLVIEASAVGAETTLSRVAHLIENAQAQKAPIQRLVDQVSSYFVPIILAIATITLVGWLLAGASVATAIINAVAVLVIACPCALGLATPAAIMAGTGVAARHGILIKDAATLEQAHAVTLVAFDKTGTLTQGQPQLTGVESITDDRDRLLAITAALQQGNSHPLALAVIAASPQPLPPPASNLKVLAGRGLRGDVDGISYLLGSERLMAESAVDTSPLAAAAAEHAKAGDTLAYLAAIDTSGERGQLLGLLSFGDRSRPTAKAAVAAVANQHLTTAIVSGDHPQSVARIGDELGINERHANLLPADKVELVQQWQQQGQVVAMVGDGINDAAALAAADVGIAIGSGTDVAMEAAGITLMRHDPALVAAALTIARKTRQKIRQNLFWAFAYNIVGVPLAAFGLLNPMMAGAAMALSSVSVVANALLLSRWHPAHHKEQP